MIRRLLLFSVSIQFLTAHIPSGYYDTAMGLSGSALQGALHNIIKDHTEYSYDDLRDFVLRNTDEDPNNSSNVLLLYTGRSQAKSTFGGGSNDWNREHVWAKSHGDFGNNPPAGTDAHHIRPTDASVNSDRGNLDFDIGGSPVSEAPGCYRDSDSFEPRDAVKGDVARMIFYMATRYKGGSGEPDLKVVDAVNTSPNPRHGKLSQLLMWNTQDPPDDFEQNRNNVIYYDYQANRNPFIDHPEFADLIWGDPTDLPSAPSNLTAENITSTSVDLTWSDTASDELGFHLYQDNQRISTLAANSTGYCANQLVEGTTYTFAVSAYNGDGESSKTSLTVTTAGGGSSSVTHFVEGFEASSGSSYIDGNFTLSSGSWNAYQAGNFTLGTPRTGSKCIAINDDKSGAHLTTPPVNTLGTISFYYYQRSGGASDVFRVEKSINGAAFELVTTQNYNVGATYTLFTTEVNDTSASVRMRIVNDDQSAHLIIDDLTVTRYEPVSVEETTQSNPSTFTLNPAFPNPFNAGTIISVTIPEQTHTTIDIYDLEGKWVSTLTDGSLSAGDHQFFWSGMDHQSEILSSGVYIIRVSSANHQKFQRITLLR